jgi:uncharacterized surface protein with fasciclin (FAS1) repeats
LELSGRDACAAYNGIDGLNSFLLLRRRICESRESLTNHKSGEAPMRKIIAALAFVVLSTPAFAAEKDIVDTAVAAGNFKTLVAAVKAAGLVDTLKGEGPFTVLAPTDEAFAKLPEGTVESLLKPENKEKLIAILTYHVIPGKAVAADVVKLDGKAVKSVQGSNIQVTVDGETVKVNDAKVIKTDIDCVNGVVHVIDTVILPPAK